MNLEQRARELMRPTCSWSETCDAAVRLARETAEYIAKCANERGDLASDRGEEYTAMALHNEAHAIRAAFALPAQSASEEARPHVYERRDLEPAFRAFARAAQPEAQTASAATRIESGAPKVVASGACAPPALTDADVLERAAEIMRKHGYTAGYLDHAAEQLRAQPAPPDPFERMAHEWYETTGAAPLADVARRHFSPWREAIQDALACDIGDLEDAETRIKARLKRALEAKP